MGGKTAVGRGYKQEGAVLKDGRTVATGLPARETATREVITLMTGRDIEYVFPERG